MEYFSPFSSDTLSFPSRLNSELYLTHQKKEIKPKLNKFNNIKKLSPIFSNNKRENIILNELKLASKGQGL